MRYKSRHPKRLLVGERDASDVKRGDNRFYRSHTRLVSLVRLAVASARL
jgi:hypothetical protein